MQKSYFGAQAIGFALFGLGWLPFLLDAGPEYQWARWVSLAGCLIVLAAGGMALWSRRQR